MLRIVHTADCHLDAPCASLDAGVRARVRAAEREALARVCALAIERSAHALVIAGDVFERSDVGPAALHHALAQFTRVTEAGIAVIVASGNHDPGRALAPLGQAGCTLALTHEPVVVELADADGAPLGHVVAIGHAGAAEGANLAQLLPPAPSPCSIAVLHAQVDGAAGARERYAPCAPEDLDRGYAYWALGHVHLRQELRSRPPAWYPGCLSPHDLGEPGAKGALVVEIDAAGRAEIEFVPLAPVRFERVRLDDLGTPGLAGLAGQAMLALEATQPGAAGEELVVRVELRGRSPLALALRDPEERSNSAEELALALGALSAELRCEHLRPPLELDKHRGQPHLLGAALEIARRGASDDALLDELAPAVLAGEDSGEPEAQRAYVASLLGELDETLAEALLAEAATSRLDRLHVGAYGPLAELELDGLAEHDLVVVYGPNEAGKSTLRSFVAAMLYGFSPAAREDHPATPLDGHAHGELELVLPDGGRVRVERHLRARPSGRTWRGEAQEELANRPLPEVAWLERGTYLALHALDADELRGLDAATWREIEQRLLGGSSPAFLRPAAVAAQELANGADALWRADRRGKPRSAELSARLAGLREARREALAGAQAHEEAAAELARVRAELARARRGEAQLEGRRDLHDRHAPALRAWQELERLRAEAEEFVPQALAARVGVQAGERLEALRGELDERRRELADVHAELEAARIASALGEREQVLIEHTATVREAALARARDEGERDQLAIERARAEGQAARSEELALRVLGHPLRTADENALETVQVADLQAAATRCERSTQAASARVAHVPAAAVVAAAALCCTLAALAAAGVGPRAPVAAGAAAAALAALALARARRGARRMRAALAERTGGWSDLVASLGDLRIAESRIAHPDHTLVGDIEQLRTLARERALTARRLAQLEEAALRAAERGATLAAVLGTDDPERLAGELEAAQRREAQALVARERTIELEPRAGAAAERAQQLAERVSELERLVRSAAPSGDEADALERLHAAATRRVAADQRERSLVEGVPELDALLAGAREREARGERMLLSDDEHATLVAELREARARAEQLLLREQQLSAELDRLGAARTVGDVEGELGAVEAELAAAKRERDRLALAAAVVRRAEREVRERYAPAWVQAASRYLEAITNGRYAGIAIVETPAGEPVLEVTRSGEPMPLRVGAPLSRGTLEQIYVAVRLALVDAVDAEARLPLFLDELFAHWDAHRLDALVRVLGAVEGRQVVVSTCHAALADRLERSCGARVVELAGPGGVLVQRPLRRLAVATAAPEQEGPTLLDLLEG